MNTVQKLAESSSVRNLELLDLNDDCLLEILNYLPIAKRVALIGVICKKIDDIAYASIARYKKLSLNFREGVEYSIRHLRILAKNLLSVNITAGYSINSHDVLKILQPIMAAALDNPLEALTINYIIFNDSYMKCLSVNVCNLLKLDLSWTQITDELLAPILNNCKRLEELRVIGNYTLNGKSLHCTTVANLCYLVVEKHENWAFACDDAVADDFWQNDTLCLVYEKGRIAFKELRFIKKTDV